MEPAGNRDDVSSRIRTPTPIGTSGTILSTERVAYELGVTKSHELTLDAVEALIERVLEFDNVDQLDIRGLSERRSQVWPGGLSILAELLNVLRIDELRVSDGALRVGLLYVILGRLQHKDARERTVQAMADRYHVDDALADRVQATAKMLLDQCDEAWGLDFSLARKGLLWAARLHEIGLDISHDGFQRHGAYIAEHADMPGFPRAEQRLLAFLISSQRNLLSTRYLGDLPEAWRQTALRLAMLLRLAVLLSRSRGNADPPRIVMDVAKDSLDLRFDAAWLKSNPLAAADLERERGYLAAIDYDLSFG